VFFADALAVPLLALALFAGTVRNELVWDDVLVIQGQLERFDSVAKIFVPPGDVPEFTLSYYRPLVLASYWLDEGLARAFWPAAERDAARRVTFHASVALAHALATLLVLLVGRELARLAGLEPAPATGAAVAGSLLFAVHPVHVESVAWMAGRSDVLCAVFALAAAWGLLAHIRGADPRALAAACAAFFLALLAKETALGLLPAAAVFELLAPRARGRIARWGGLGGATVAYLLLRAAAVHGSTSFVLLAPLDLVRTGLAALGWYTAKLVWPFPQQAFFLRMPGAGYAIAGAGVLLAASALVVLAARRGAARAEALHVALALGTLAPALALAVGAMHVAPAGGSAAAWKHGVQFAASSAAGGIAPIAERYLYLPSAGACLLLGALLARLRLPARIGPWGAPALALLVALPAALATRQRATVFRSAIDFWSDAAAKTPELPDAHLQLADLLAAQGRTDEALARLRAGIARTPEAGARAALHNRAGTLLLDARRPAEALLAFRAMAEDDPRSATAHFNWAIAELSLSHREEGLRLLARTLELNPAHVRARYYLGTELLRAGRDAEGIAELRRLVEMHPQSEEAARARKVLAR